MALVKSASGVEILEIGGTSKAMRGSIYTSSGDQILTAPSGSYSVYFYTEPSVSLVNTGNVHWYLANPGPRTAYLKRINLTMAFDATALATTAWAVSLQRFALFGVVNDTAPTATFRKSGLSPAPSAAHAEDDDTGVQLVSSFGKFEPGIFASFVLPVSVTSTRMHTTCVFEDPTVPLSGLAIPTNHGIALRTLEGYGSITSINATLAGNIEWDEK